MAKVGRPLKTTKDFPKDWKEWILKEMGEGASLTEVDAYLDVDNETRQRMMNDDEEFFATIKKGLRLSASWWEMQGRVNLQNKDFSYTGFYMNMKNRFGWRDRQDVTSDDSKLDTGVVMLPTKNES